MSVYVVSSMRVPQSLTDILNLWFLISEKRIVLRLTVRSNVKPKCGNNSSKSLHVFLCPMGPCSRLSYLIASVQVNGPMQLLIASLLTVLPILK